MHELSLCRAIVGIINDTVGEKPHQHIKKIGLEIGRLTAVDEAALRFGFEVLTKNTRAEHAVLDIIPIDGQALCESCQKTGRIEHYYDVCQYCGHFPVVITHGEELRVTFMEIS